jgi:hypothetical protein
MQLKKLRYGDLRVVLGAESSVKKLQKAKNIKKEDDHG